jgi:mRNA-degrading endonuclease toxin of MazEF toxin-antitoxin module
LDVCVIGITTIEHKAFSMRVPLKAGDGGLHSDCWAKCDQVTTLERRLLQYPAIGTLSGHPKFAAIMEQVKITLGLIEGPSLREAIQNIIRP